MIDLEAITLPDSREECVGRIRDSLSDICSTRKILVDGNVFVPPCLLSVSSKSKDHPVIEELHRIYSKEGIYGVSYIVMGLSDFYFDYINTLSDFVMKDNIFILETNYNCLRGRINGLKKRKKIAKNDKDNWEEFILSIALPVYKYIRERINDTQRKRENFIICEKHQEKTDFIRRIVNQNMLNEDKILDFEKKFIERLFSLKYDGFTQNNYITKVMKESYKNLRYVLGDYHPRVLSINFQTFCVESHDIYN